MLISDFGIASMLNHTIKFNLVTKMVRFDISIKPTTWTRQETEKKIYYDFMRFGDSSIVPTS